MNDSALIKTALGIASGPDVAAIAAFGCGVKTTKRLRVNILSMPNVDIGAQRQYDAPKHGRYDMVFMNAWGSCDGLDGWIGFYDDMLREAFHAATLSPR